MVHLEREWTLACFALCPRCETDVMIALLRLSPSASRSCCPGVACEITFDKEIHKTTVFCDKNLEPKSVFASNSSGASPEFYFTKRLYKRENR